MKKYFIYILILLMPIMIKAESNKPEQIDYEVNTNQELNLYNDINEIISPIPRGTDLNIDYELKKDNILYGYTTYNDNNGFIDLSNVTLKNNKLSTSSMARSEALKLVTISSTDIYKGPSIKYDKIDSNEQIPKLQELTSYYYDDVWAYIDYNGTTGWIYIYSCEENNPYGINSTVGRVEQKEINLMTTSEVTLYRTPLKLEDPLEDTIAEKTELSYKYYYQLHKGTKFIYVEDDDLKGWFEVNYKDDDNLAAFDYGCYSAFVTNDYIYFYAKYNDLSSKTSIKIPKKTELKILYTATIENKYDWYYVNYNGSYGWIISTQYSSETETPPFAVYKGTSYKYSTNSVINVYELPNGKQSDVTIPASTTFVGTYTLVYEGNKWIYVTYNNESGWIKAENIKTNSSYPECLDIEEYEENSVYDTSTDSNKNDEETVSKNNKSYKDLIIKIILFLVIIAGIIYVYFKFFKKKNKKESKELSNQNIEPINQVQSINNVINQNNVVVQPVIQQPQEPKVVPIDGITNVVPIEDNLPNEITIKENELFKEQPKEEPKDYENRNV